MMPTTKLPIRNDIFKAFSALRRQLKLNPTDSHFVALEKTIKNNSMTNFSLYDAADSLDIGKKRNSNRQGKTLN